MTDHWIFNDKVPDPTSYEVMHLIIIDTNLYAPNLVDILTSDPQIPMYRELRRIINSEQNTNTCFLYFHENFMVAN